MNETWVPITEFDGLYEISSLGRVRSIDKIIPYKKSIPGSTSLRKGKLLKPNTFNNNYHLYTFTFNKKHYYRYSHRLVVTYFISKIPDNMTVNHKDGIKSNNSIENLEICTKGENNTHAGLINLKPIGSKHSNSKLTHKDLKQVRILLKEKKLTHKEIGKLFNVVRSTITGIARNVSYRKEIT